ncbi:ABC transporter ATP-binding protein [Acinetobacter sp. MD2]|uniref:ABC transporter ATP-binding protein n=1 Tax=Acinetobacter sp. MD2 TaxID=2600066 RepID=UPI002D1ED763|nr:ABC transporter ATP-binding protein [Acinetobacter sp. MD2]MEB3766986.1 ABC transporter ATP-binding protein [Acinetobacter sp. MD2]
MMPEVPRLALVGVSKSYNALKANDQISLTVLPGQIHAILGENGAGKSTLMKIIYGAVKADQGSVIWNGKEVQIDRPASARKLGIGMVYQHFSLFETLTVTENIALGLDESVELKQLSEKIKTVSEQYGLPIDPRREVHSLSVGERQRVEIIRCLLQNPSLLILDEPTSVLTPQAVQQLFKTLKQLASQGVSILYISHKLHEIKALCDEATIIRAGRVTGTVNPKQKTTNELASLMIGRELPTYSRAAFMGDDACIFGVEGINFRSDDPFSMPLNDIHLELKQGEILGVAGISGNGQAELLSLLSGETTTQQDKIRFKGQKIGHLNAGQRRDLGLGFVPEERLGRGAVPNMTLNQNTLLTAYRQDLTHFKLINFAKVKQFTEQCIQRFGVKASGVEAEARSLSGGNLQKFIVGREILQQPEVLIISQPTWGVDIGAAMFIRQTLIDLSRQGVAILVVSEELEELFEISDRIAVLAEGRLSKPMLTQSTNAEKIGLLMSGLGQSTPNAASTDVVG